MKKTLLLVTVMLLSAGSIMAQEVVQEANKEVVQETAQEQSKIRLNAGLVYGTKAGLDKGGIGLNIGGEYFFTEQISAAPSLTYFFKSKHETSSYYGSFVSSVQNTSVNLDGRYYFAEREGISFYGLAGLAIASTKAVVKNSEGKVLADGSDSEVGVNLGAGLVYPYSEKFSLNGQIKYSTPFKQLVLQAGVTVPINL